MEEWRSTWFRSDYEVSDEGRVRRILPSGSVRILKQHMGPRGYYSVVMRKDGITKRLEVHRLVALAFPTGEGPVVRHLNGDPADNRAINLRLGTPRENSADLLAHGRHVHANKTHCVRGHEYDDANTYRFAGGRFCRKCSSIRTREYRARKTNA